MDDESSKFEKFKQHLRENKKVYLAAGSGILVGGTVVGIIALRHMGLQMPEIQQTAKNTALIVWKSPPTNIALVRKACPDPIPVLDKLTGEAYPSISRAVKVTGKNFYEISKDAQGLQKRFERLPNSVFA